MDQAPEPQTMMSGIYTTVAVFLVVGIGSGLTVFLNDALTSSQAGGSLLGAGFWLAVIMFSAPLIGAGTGFYLGRTVQGDRQAYLAALIGAAIGYAVLYATLYLFNGLIIDSFGSIEILPQLGILLGVTATAVLASVVAANADKW